MAMDTTAVPPSDPDALQLLDPYPGNKAGRHTQLAVTWESKAITRDLAGDLKSLVYVDNLTGAADDLQIELEDRDSLWSGDWRPETGDKVVARLKSEGWFGFGQPVTDLRLGTFAHDKITLSGPPRQVVLYCVSAPLATSLRRRKRTKTWRGVNLKQIAQDVADRASLTLGFDGDPGPAYKHAQQNNKSDLEFLEELCKEVGRTLKVTESTITIYDERDLDGRPSVGEIDILGGFVIGWSFDADDSARYGSAHVTCHDPRSGKVHKLQFPPDGVTIPGLDPNGQTLEMIVRVSDRNEAAKRAEKLLRYENGFANRGKLTVVGDCGLVAGVTFDLLNAFTFDGKYMITRAEHRAGNGPYTTTLDIRRCIEGY